MATIPLPIQLKNLKHNLTGRTFGRLFVVEFSHRTKGRIMHWVVACSCGQLTYPTTANLLRSTRSCGCLSKEITRERSLKHGHAVDGKETRLYRIWRGMITRCRSTPKQKELWKYYGSRGIKACPEWEDSFPVFKEWAESNGYQDHLTIDRINNDDGYTPANCRWATWFQQHHNRRPFIYRKALKNRTI